ncbi:unnamed protein product [Echinostoma caproni]|uniref:Helicase ATP-binding domain-containing protein n=1 Tax=Echinostoma caproni TaxID=27848 RepID=A0A183ACV0_9TREM|nr:unnamed protein product [Echinostoma caproni]
MLVAIDRSVNEARPVKRDFPRLTVALRRFGSLTQPSCDESDACCSIESKRAYMAGASYEDYSSLKAESLWGRLSALLPTTVNLERKRTLEKLVQQYADSCLDLVGRDSSDVREFASHATLLCFGQLGPKVIDLLSRGVSISDLSRHYAVQKEKEAIVSKVGGTGARNPNEVWTRVFSNLGSLLSHPLMQPLVQELSDVMRQCRVAVESEENSCRDVLGSSHLVKHSRELGHRRRAALKSLDWDSVKVAQDELQLMADKLGQVLFGCSEMANDKTGTDAISASSGNDFKDTDALRQAFAAPLRPVLNNAPSASGQPCVDWTRLTNTLSSKAAGLGMPVEEVVDMVFSLLDSNQSDEVVQNELCELIGWDYVELVFDLLTRRKEWIAAYGADPSDETANSIAPQPTEPQKPVPLKTQIVDSPHLLAQARAAQLEANARETAKRLQHAMQSGPSVSTRVAEFMAGLPYVFDAAAQVRASLGQSDIVYLAPMKALAAELAETFTKRLSPLGLRVRECTGDMQLTKQEILETQMLVSTPEKWDVISRKGSGDATLVKLVKLLIIDEIHLLHEDRGAVIEVLVARTLRQVETSQTMIRLVGLSATLPNYVDVARFLHVNLHRGLFYFDDRFRPVPLHMSFVGVRGASRKAQEQHMNEACYEKVLDQVKNGEQVMVFVHARGDTVRTARWIRDNARQLGHMSHFRLSENEETFKILKKV